MDYSTAPLFHRHPELGFELPKTQAHLCEALREIGLTPRQLKCGGVLAELGGREKPCILLRADMDALPLTECSGVPFASEHPGMMHACGHDTHMAMLLGAAAMLKQHEAELQGKVLICFQPAEEIMRGAEALLQELPTEPDFAFALHIFPRIRTRAERSSARRAAICPQAMFCSHGNRQIRTWFNAEPRPQPALPCDGNRAGLHRYDEQRKGSPNGGRFIGVCISLRGNAQHHSQQLLV